MRLIGKQTIFPCGLLVILLVLLGSTRGDNIIARQGWGMLALEIVIITIALLYWDFEQGRASSREVAVIAILGTIAAVARIPFAALPGVQPTTFIVIISGLFLVAGPDL